ncbi:hypothetical protein IT398_02820 [Candidatus Nomurabacteria bacterium]|nr:hypothetical protein [Candidatus Nomurabacteria bacterium]
MKRTLDLDEIFLDASNLPSFNKQQFEDYIERPVSRKTFYFFSGFFLLIGLIFIGQTFNLQLLRGEALAARSENNTLRQIPIFAERGILTDRFGEILAWNDNGKRLYIEQPGLAHLLGYVSQIDGEELKGLDGVEKIFNERLRGQTGTKIEEVDVTGKNQSDYLLEPPVSGQNLTLAIDARLQSEIHHAIANLVSQGRFEGGAGVFLDTETGEILALTNMPEYDSNVLSTGSDRAKINGYLQDKNFPFLNRAVAGLYTPGSIVKPIMAVAALNENLISPSKKILSTGQLVVPNPYFPGQPSIFKDWKAHGWTDMRDALAVSSDVYFYTIGGGFGDQVGLGIERIAKYARLFGLGENTGSEFPNEAVGTVPTPEWKKSNFEGAEWLLGNTYHTVIGQYGFQVTPLQVARVVSALGNGGRLVKPRLLAIQPGEVMTWDTIPGVNTESLKVVGEGMRRSVTIGTAIGLNIPSVAIAAKTGTAELGVTKNFVNSWVTGFFPYENPRYAFALVMERGKRTNLIGATAVMRQVFDWMKIHAPEYFEN